MKFYQSWVVEFLIFIAIITGRESEYYVFLFLFPEMKFLFRSIVQICVED